MRCIQYRMGSWLDAISHYATFTGASARLVGMLAGLAVFYGLIGWGVRYALSSDREPI